MQIKLSAICEYVSIDNTGKLNLLGIFDAINATSFPVTVSKMYLVLVVHGENNEIGEHDVILKLTGANGKNLIDPGLFKFNLNQGINPSSNVIIDFNNLQIPSAGDYLFEIAVDENLELTIPLKVSSLN